MAKESFSKNVYNGGQNCYDYDVSYTDVFLMKTMMIMMFANKARPNEASF